MLLHLQKYLKPGNTQKGPKSCTTKPVDNQSATKHALLADQTATTSGEEHVASPPKVSEARKYPKRAKKLHQNQLIIRVPQSVLYWLIKQPPHQVGNILLHLQKYLKPKKYPAKKAAPKLVVNQSATKAMASDSDMDVEDYYIVEDANESASSKYVPCINYPNDKVYPEDEKNGWVRLDQDTGPLNIYRFEGSCQNYMDLNNYTPGAVLMSFLKVKCGQY